MSRRGTRRGGTLWELKKDKKEEERKEGKWSNRRVREVMDEEGWENGKDRQIKIKKREYAQGRYGKERKGGRYRQAGKEERRRRNRKKMGKEKK